MLLKRSNINTFVSIHKAQYVGEWFSGTYVDISKVILASQGATVVLSTTVTTEPLFKPEAAIGILQVFSGIVILRF